jgi:hypothetical protein
LPLLLYSCNGTGVVVVIVLNCLLSQWVCLSIVVVSAASFFFFPLSLSGALIRSSAWAH